LSETLLTFERPPVVEVALAVQFEPNTVSALHAALFRARIRDEFPAYEEQVARPPMQETFTLEASPPPISVQLIPGSPGNRYWFLTPDGSRLIQLQHDLLAVNWRRVPEGGGDYPLYPALRSALVSRLQDLNEILHEQDQTPIKPNWCEATYINHVPPRAGESERAAPHRLLNWFAQPTDAFLPPAEDLQMNARFVIGEEEQPSRGRLHLGLGSAFRAEDRVPIWILTLTARTRSQQPTVEGALASLDEAREWADRSIDELATPEMHEAWGLKPVEQNELSR
jgi:uncharacterized protein (TIGR04255 family)